MLFHRCGALSRGACLEYHSGHSLSTLFSTNFTTFFRGISLALNIVHNGAHNNNMSDFMKLFRREKSGDDIHVRREPAYTGAVGRKTLEDIFDGCSDFSRARYVPDLPGTGCFLSAGLTELRPAATSQRMFCGRLPSFYARELRYPLSGCSTARCTARRRSCARALTISSAISRRAAARSYSRTNCARCALS